MSCCIPNEETIEQIRNSLSSNQSQILGTFENVTELLRGGYVVKTKIGNIQVGLPPETVKDSIVQGLDIPNLFVIPSRHYSKESFINVAEFEFPAYFNFFVKRKRIRLICTTEQEEKIRIIFQETLLGPKEFPNLDEEFSEMLPRSYRPNFIKELGGMAVNPFTKEKLTLETLIEFSLFDEKNECKLEDGVKVVKGTSSFSFFDGEKLIAKIQDKIVINPESYATTKMITKEKRELAHCCSHSEKDHHEKVGSKQELIQDKILEDSDEEASKIAASPIGFVPPYFGVTILGASHGFDASGSTSGYILWINQRGVMVDPPPFSSQNLADFGIPPNLIDKCILTHCHADHDSGIFQKIMHSNTIELITTPTVLGSFIRKYSALTGIEPSVFQKMFIFRPVTIGSFIDVLGASFRFFYSYHSIPCLGFEVNYCGKMIFFSGDTYFDPAGLEDRLKQGIFSKERFDSLVDVNWSKYDIILHEAGVPPIHTPPKVLAEFPEEVKKRMYLVHVAEKDIPAGCGLQAAKPGITNTLSLDVNPQLDATMQKLELLSSIKFLNEIPLYKTRDLVRCCKVESFMAGQTIIKEKTYGSKFYIVMTGICKISSDVPAKKFSKFAYTGDYFGETALIDTEQGKRNADVTAYTNATLLCLDKSDFKWVFGIVKHTDGNFYSTDNATCSLVERLKNLTATRKNKYSEFVNQNVCFRALTESQKVQVNMFIKYEKIPAGTIMWSETQPPTYCFFLISGDLDYKIPEEHAQKKKIRASIGGIYGDFPCLSGESPCKSTMTAVTDVEILCIKKEDWLIFLGKNPGLMLVFKEVYHVY